MRRETFEHFYLTKIALAEGCGCAEHVTRMREVEDACAGRQAACAPSGRWLLATASWLKRAGKSVQIRLDCRQANRTTPDPGTGS